MRILRSSIVLVKKDNQFLLGYNKKGFSREKWTGFGGVVQPKEDLKMCALRNTKEQCGLTLEKLEKVGKIEIKFAGVQELVQVHIFIADAYTGELSETKVYKRRPVWEQEKVENKNTDNEDLRFLKSIRPHLKWITGMNKLYRNDVQNLVMKYAYSTDMKPGWFGARDMPYKNMWADANYWLPHILEGKKIKGFFVYQNETLIYQDLNTDAFNNARFPRPRNPIPVRGILSR